MKLVLLGLPEVSYSWKNQIQKDAMKHLGWEVVHLSPRKSSASQIIANCKKADLFIWAYTHGYEIGADVLRKVDNLCPTVSLHMDLYWGIPHRERLVGRHLLWKSDYVFTADGGNQERFESRGVNHFWMSPGLTSDAIYIGNQSDEFLKHDIVFVGSCDKQIHVHRTTMLKEIERRYGPRFAWHNNVRGQKLNDLFASTKVVLGDSADPKLYPPDKYWSDRIPVTLGRGGVLVHPYVNGMDESDFIDGYSLRTFEHGDLIQLQEIIDELLEDAIQRSAIRERGMKTIWSQHTWAHKLKQIEEIVF